MKTKIAERKSGYRCRDCGKVFRTEEAAFAHQARACSPTPKRRTAPRPGKTKELTWYRITDGIADHTTDKWSEVIDAVTDWYDHVAYYEPPEGSSDPDPENFPNPVAIYALKDPDVDRLRALIQSWESEIEEKYGYSLDLKVTRISELDARSVPA